MTECKRIPLRRPDGVWEMTLVPIDYEPSEVPKPGELVLEPLDFVRSVRMPAPDGNPKTAFGQRKVGLHAIPPVALLWLGDAMEEGRRKYGITNWRDDAVTSSVYVNALHRHLLAYLDGQDLDPESPTGRTPHLAKIMACCAILLDAEAQGTLTNDRGTPGRGPDLIAKLTVAE